MKISTCNQLLSKKMAAIFLLMVSGWALAQQASPSFSLLIQPDTIGPGSTTDLIFNINNTSNDVVDSMAFSLNLPASVILGENSDNQCNGTLTAPVGGAVMSLVDGEVSASSICQITVSVTSSTPAIHTFTTSPLSTSAGTSASATDDLTVAADRPGFTQSFSPSSVNRGERSTLTFTIDNSLNASDIASLTFLNDLPLGLAFASPQNLSSTCTNTLLTADAVQNKFTMTPEFFGLPSVLAGASCIVTVDVKATGAGFIQNQSGELTGSLVPGFGSFNAGFSEATIESISGDVLLQKDFTDDPVPPGGTVNLAYTINNFDRNTGVTNVAFTDDIDNALSGLTATGLPLSNVCGAGSSLSFSGGVLSLSGGSLPVEGLCTFSVALQVPIGASPGGYSSTSGAISYLRGGTPAVGNTATDVLYVTEAPIISKTFTDDPVTGGGSVTLQFTITNSSSINAATAINFIDELTTFIPFPISATLPVNGFCGAGSAMTLIGLGTDRQGLFMNDGDLTAGDSCTFDVIIDIPLGMPSGNFLNTTEPVSATVAGVLVSGNQAEDTLVVVAAPGFTKSFIDDPVLPGDLVTLEFSLSHGLEESFDATAISFTDDLDATLSGLVAVGLPVNDVCGVGSSISGTSVLTFTGGTLAPGDTCDFSVTLQVPVAAALGTYPNTTSNVSAVVGGLSVSNLPATDDLNLSGMEFTITNIPDTFIAGVAVTYNLEFNLTNLSPVDDATGIFATLNLSSVIPGLTATTLPAPDSCGPGSSVIGTTFLIFLGGNLAAGSSCTFSVQVLMPATASVGDYTLITSNLAYTSGGTPLVADPASDILSVIDGLFFEKSFVDDPISAGDTVTLNFDITNNSGDYAASGMTFTDDLDATLSGLVAVGLPLTDVCGVGSQISGAGLLTLTGGNLPAGASCQFDVTLQVPASAAGGNYTNTTSAIGGMMAGGTVAGNLATDDLQIRALLLTKSFAAAVAAGSTVDLTFELVNEDSVNSQQGIRFTDDLNAMISGAVATGLPVVDVCGVGSVLSGSSVITLLNGTLDPTTSCQFTVTVSIPIGTAAGMYPNITSAVSAGTQSGEPATDTLRVIAPPVFSKAFSVAQENLNQVFTLSFDVDNSASSLAASNLSFVDNLPAGTEVANPANATTTCTGGTIMAAVGSASVSYTGGSVAANGSCQLAVDLVAVSAGIKNNLTGDLTSSSGSSGTASASIEIVAAPLFSKAFSSPQASLNQPVALTLTIDNSVSPLAASGLDFLDNFPAGLEVANPANATTTCTGGTLTAGSGTASVSYSGGSVAANATCTVSVDVIGTSSGIKTNLTGDLTSDAGNSGTATADIEIFGALIINKSFTDIEVNAGDLVDVNFAIQNNNPVAVTAISFTDDLDAFITGALAVGLPQNDVCGLGSMVAGTNIISLSAGQLAAGQSCVITVSVQIPANTNGSFVNLTSPISYTINGNPVIDEPNTAGNASLSVLGEPVTVPMNQYMWFLLLIMLWVTFHHFKRMRRL